MNDSLSIEPAFFAISGHHYPELIQGFWMGELQGCIDAPLFIPRGSLQSSHTTACGRQYVTSTEGRQ